MSSVIDEKSTTLTETEIIYTSKAKQTFKNSVNLTETVGPASISKIDGEQASGELSPTSGAEFTTTVSASATGDIASGVDGKEESATNPTNREATITEQTASVTSEIQGTEALVESFTDSVITTDKEKTKSSDGLLTTTHNKVEQTTNIETVAI